MRHTTLKGILLATLAVVFVGCKDFLDKNPDMRATIDSKEKVQKLLVSAYMDYSFAAVCETSSDNIIDNNSPNPDNGEFYNKAALSQFYDELFAWDDVVSSNQQDSPYSIWTGCYSSIAVANQALKAIETLEAEGINMDAERAEALLCRAYHHFLLVNIFCQAYKDSVLSENDLGIYYMKEPETIVSGYYPRTTVAETYRHIQADLEEALPIVSDEYYNVPKYHFNAQAANAFAARFYLFKRDYDKVIACANNVLGTTAAEAASMMFDASHARLETSYPTSEVYAWIDASSNSNLLLRTSVSSYFYSILSSYGRYQFNRDARTYTVQSSGPCWTSRFPGFNVWSNDSNLGSFVAKFWYFFEYSDKVAGIGFVRGMHRDFTANETLLCRAEAKIFKNDFDGALSDLQVWTQGYNVQRAMSTLTRSSIENFYTSSRTNIVRPLHNTDMSPSFTVSSAQLPWIQCVLHFRRIETLHDGLRFFDIKRYGIEITHSIGNNPNLRTTLIWNDDRRAIQLPQEVIVAGIEGNPRVTLGSGAKQATQKSPGYAFSGDPNPAQIAALNIEAGKEKATLLK